MATDLTQAISFSLAPGIALTSGIFFYNALQTRFGRISSLVRDLNKEARGLSAGGEATAARRTSVRLQVSMLEERSRILHRALIASYAGLIGMCVTMLVLLAMAFVGLESTLTTVALVTFGGGLSLQAASMLISSRELVIARNTLIEDVRSTFEVRTAKATDPA